MTTATPAAPASTTHTTRAGPGSHPKVDRSFITSVARGGGADRRRGRRWHARFPILARSTYPRRHDSLGAMPDAVPASLHACAEPWATLGVQAWGGDWLPGRSGASLSCCGGSSAPTRRRDARQNVATLTAIVVSALELTQADTVVWRPTMARHRLPRASSASTRSSSPRVTGSSTMSTRLRYRHRQRWPFSHLSDRRRRSGPAPPTRSARCAWSTGSTRWAHMPSTWRRSAATSTSAGSVKWLCGGPGVASSSSSSRASSDPRPADEVGRLGHAAPFDFDRHGTPPAGDGLAGGHPCSARP